MKLSVRGLAVARGGVPVLERVSFELRPGRALILKGANGAGKTTLLRTLAGLQAPRAGHVMPGRDAIAYAGHLDGMKAQLTVAENLDFWARLHGAGGVELAMGAFGLLPLEDRLAQHLSAGQRRRLGLARLLVTGRPIWLLDEPTVSLDAENAARFTEVVRAHLKGGGTAVLASHVDLRLDGKSLDLARFRARPADPFLAGLPA